MYRRRTVIAYCRNLTALDHKAVFPQERAYAQSWWEKEAMAAAAAASSADGAAALCTSGPAASVESLVVLVTSSEAEPTPRVDQRAGVIIELPMPAWWLPRAEQGTSSGDQRRPLFRPLHPVPVHLAAEEGGLLSRSISHSSSTQIQNSAAYSALSPSGSGARAFEIAPAGNGDLLEVPSPSSAPLTSPSGMDATSGGYHQHIVPSIHGAGSLTCSATDADAATDAAPTIDIGSGVLHPAFSYLEPRSLVMAALSCRCDLGERCFLSSSVSITVTMSV